jgi:TatD DNase family protein
MLIDTHAHINLHAFKNDADEVLQRSFAVDVSVINVGTEYSTSKQAVTMLEQCPERVYAAIGLHPSHTYDNPYLDENESAFVTKREEFNYESYKQLALHPKVVGIGECGLDYYRLPDDTSTHESIKVLQKDAFLQQIKLAQELDKTLIIHCRSSKGSDDAYEDVIETISRVRHSESRRFGRGEESQSQEEILRSLSLSQNDGVRALRFEIHSFTGSPEVAQKFLDLGGYIGFNGIITFDKTGNMEQVVKAVPLERIVLETDSPYLAPTPYRGKRNEPVYIVEVAKKIAEWKSIGLEQLGATTTRNAQELFRLTWQDGG